MKLRGVEFGNVLGASGVQGFFGEGYWFHRPWHPFGLDFSGMTFVSKTATLFRRDGNMKLTRQFTPKYPFPGCVKAHLRDGVMLNSVGLSNPGLNALLRTGRWQNRRRPFLISLMSLADSPKQRLEELHIMTDIIGRSRDRFFAPFGFGLQVNLSCPNTGHDPRVLIEETAAVLDIVGKLGVPVMPKFSIATAPISAVMQLNDHPSCDAICVSNTLPFGWEGIDWQKVWGSRTSPLAKLGGGGLSGTTLKPLVCQWISRLREIGFQKPINGGGGILYPEDVGQYRRAGASSVFLGSVAVLRPWRVKSIIDEANRLKWR